MKLKTLALMIGASMLLSCSVQAGNRHGSHDGHHGNKHHGSHYQKRHKHRHYKRADRRHDCQHRSHYRSAAYGPVHAVPRLQVGIRYGFPAGEAMIVYQPYQPGAYGY